VAQGSAATVLRCRLDDGAVEFLDRPVASRAFLGGRGLGVALLAEYGHPDRAPLDATQPFILAAGPLTGTAAPSSGRFAAVAPSPLTGTVFDSNAGGRFGVRLRQAGLDALLLEGRAAEWSVVVVDGRSTGSAAAAGAPPAAGREPGLASVRVIPLSLLWPEADSRAADLTWSRTVAGLRSALGPGFSLVLPGPAGRRGALLGSLRTDDGRCLGRGGLGAALAAKRVFAVAVAGDRPLPVADPDRFAFVVYEAQKQVAANPVTSRALPEFGTAVLMQLVHHAGALPALNFRTTVWPGVDRICGEAVRDELIAGRKGCFGCQIRCTPRMGRVARGCAAPPAAPGGGPSPEVRAGAEGPEYETLWAFGAACGIDDLEAIQEANRLCGEYGLDTISAGATIACAMELSEMGALGRVLRFADAERMVELVAQMGAGGGFGLELQDGSARLAVRYGHPELSMHVKGLELPAYDPRGMHGQGLAYATSNRGACHLRGNMVGPEILGIPKMIDRFASAGKSGILVNLQHLSAVFDSVGLCKFAGFAFGEEVVARLLSACRGEPLGAQDLLRAGERTWNLERLWNLAAGFSAADDTLPPRILCEPHAEGPSAGHTVDLPAMLGEYYRARGWDEHGVPSSEKVAALGLEAEAAVLADERLDTHAGSAAWQGWRPDVADDEVRGCDGAHSGGAPAAAAFTGAVDSAKGDRHLRAVP